MATPSGVPTYETLFTSCVLYYDMNGDAKDVTSNNNDGTVTGATLTTDYFGNSNRAYSFNGTSNYMTVADDDTLSFTNGSGVDEAFSFIFWVNFTDMTEIRLFSKGSTGNWEWEIIIDPDDKINVFCYLQNISAYLGAETTSAQTSMQGSWHMVTVTYDGSEAFSGFNIYVDDGASIALTNVGSGSYTGMTNTNNVVYIGQFTGGSQFLDGDLGQVMIWKDRELTSDEKDEIYTLTSKKYIYPYPKKVDE